MEIKQFSLDTALFKELTQSSNKSSKKVPLLLLLQLTLTSLLILMELTIQVKVPSNSMAKMSWRLLVGVETWQENIGLCNPPGVMTGVKEGMGRFLLESKS
jgi:hypothetical protein